jgi:hypothetical protein
MAQDHFLDLLESGEEWWVKAWRCINCGYVLDPVVEDNRRRQGATASAPRASVAVEQVAEDHREGKPDFNLAA